MVINILSNRSEWTFYFLSSVQFNFTISEKGFSTKKEHSGLGLSTIRKITETYENMSITYDISNDYFDFYLVMDREV